MTSKTEQYVNIETRPYAEFEFCKAVNCNRLVKSSVYAGQFQCLVGGNDKCVKTLKQFNRWLSDNNFIILKLIEEDDENN